MPLSLRTLVRPSGPGLRSSDRSGSSPSLRLGRQKLRGVTGTGRWSLRLCPSRGESR